MSSYVILLQHIKLHQTAKQGMDMLPSTTLWNKKDNRPQPKAVALAGFPVKPQRGEAWLYPLLQNISGLHQWMSTVSAHRYLLFLYGKGACCMMLSSFLVQHTGREASSGDRNTKLSWWKQWTSPFTVEMNLLSGFPVLVSLMERWMHCKAGLTNVSRDK